jgi:hypothetical protein
MTQLALFTEDETDREVPLSELKQIWERARRDGTIYNGCTEDELRRRYGSRLARSPSGWLVRGRRATLPAATSALTATTR